MIFETHLPQLIIRTAIETDIPLILSFIRELAEYERLAHEVTATEELLKESLFSDHPKAEVLIAEYQHQPVAFAVFFHNFSTFLGRSGIYLEDVYVKPALRGKGIGKAILICLAKIAVDRNCGRLEWSVLDWNESAITFYEHLGAVPMDEWTVYRLTGDSFLQLAKQQ